MPDHHEPQIPATFGSSSGFRASGVWFTGVVAWRHPSSAMMGLALGWKLGALTALQTKL